MASADYDWIAKAIDWGVPVVFYAGAIWASYKSIIKRVEKLEAESAGLATKGDIEQINDRLEQIYGHLLSMKRAE